MDSAFVVYGIASGIAIATSGYILIDSLRPDLFPGMKSKLVNYMHKE